jgi:hypothetical protein
MRLLGRLAPLIFAVFAAGRAHAETLPYHIEYDAAPDCSSRAVFVQELLTRTPLVREAQPDEEGATFVVKLVDNGGTVAGELTFRESLGGETRRAVSGSTCDEVVPALALIAAVLVDPEALSRKAPEPERIVEPERPREKPSRLRFGGAAGVSLASAVSPNLGIGGFVEFAAEHESDGRRSFAFGVALHRTWSETYSTPDGDADFTWTAARGWFCPISLPNRGVFAFSPCAAIEAGQLHAEGSRTLDEDEASVFWLAAAPLLRLELRPVRVLSIFADGLAVFPLLREYSFRFDPETEVFSTPTVGWAAQAGVRVLFP